MEQSTVEASNLNESISVAVGLLVFIGLGVIAMLALIIIGWICIKRRRVIPNQEVEGKPLGVSEQD